MGEEYPATPVFDRRQVEKLDGVRVRAHRDGDEVRVFTRTLDDITSRVPEVVEAVRALPVRSTVGARRGR